jgi:flagellar protein FliO/FliZ
MMRVVAATAVGSRERVVIVEVGSTWLVLGVAPGRVSALAEIPRQAVPESPPSPAQTVAADWLQRFVPRR